MLPSEPMTPATEIPPAPTSPPPLSVRRAVPALAGLAGMAAVLSVTLRHGVGYTADSADYVAAARGLGAGEGLTSVSGGLYLTHPPGIPLLLALPAALGLDPAAAFAWLDALAFGVTLGVVGGWLFKHLRDPALAGVGLLAVALSQPLLLVACVAWSEAPFIALTVAALAVAGRYLEAPRAGPLAAFGLLAGLAFLTRYAGAPLVLLGGLLVLARPGPWGRRLGHAAAFGALGGLPVLAWLGRNQLVAGTLFGSREAATGGLADAVGRTGRVVGMWFWPFPGAPGLPAVSVAAGLAALCLVLAALWRGRAGAAREGTKAGGQGAAAWAPALPWAGFALVYAVFIVAAKSRIGEMEGRYLFPLVAPLYLLGVFAADRALARAALGLSRPRAWGAALAVALGVWLAAYPAPLGLSLVRDMSRFGVPEFGTVFWQARAVVRRLAEPLPDGLYLSNAPEVVYWNGGRRASPVPPRAALAAPAGAEALRSRVAAAAPQGGAWVVWFRMPKRQDLANPGDLARVVTLAPVWTAPDGSGAIFRALPPGAAAPPPPPG